MHEKMIDINALRLPVRMAGDIEPVPSGVLLPQKWRKGLGRARCWDLTRCVRLAKERSGNYCWDDEEGAGRLIMRRYPGSYYMVDLLTGDFLPRIC